jgi:extracellular elastinolytic metalloproteinase
MPVAPTRQVRRRLCVVSLVVALAGSFPGLASANPPDMREATTRPSIDVAFLDTRRPIATRTDLVIATERARAALDDALGRPALLELDPRTGTPRFVGLLDGYLTAARASPARSVAMGFVHANLDAFGLTSADLRTFVFRKDYVDVDGIHHLSWTQVAHGMPAFDNGLEAAVTRDGRLVNVTGSPAHGLGVGVGDVRPTIGATSATERARLSVGATAAPARGDTASLVLFYGGRSHLAWQTLTNVSEWERDLSIVDATTGDVLWRSNLVDAAVGTGLAWEYYPSTKVPNGGGEQQPVSFPVTRSDRLFGNDAHVYADPLDDNVADPGDEIPPVSDLDWSYPLAPFAPPNQNCEPRWQCTWNKNVAHSWGDNLDQAAVQVYYYLNQYHDHLLQQPIGFTEAAGNFQARNFTGKGKGGDAVQGQVVDGAATSHGLPDANHYNNANFFTPPDGSKPVMQMYLFHKDALSPGWPSAFGGNDASVVYHEYTHGLSSRLVTYPNGVQALNTQQSGAMGEAWSDWYAMDFLVDQGWATDGTAVGDVKMGKWITGGQGIRFQGIDCIVGAPATRCPAGFRSGSGGFTYGDFGRVYLGPEVHSDGEIWGQTLWDLRRRLGVSASEKLITRGMQLSPPEPSFLDMRNAILQADHVVFDGTNRTTIWKVFAHRGMGYFASAVGGDDVKPTENFSAPPSCATATCGAITGRLTNSVTGRPVKGVLVAIGGHSSGFPGTDLRSRTGGDGRFTIRHVPFHRYADVVIDRRGIEPVVLHGVRVNGTEHINRAVTRDWAALDGGASVTRSTPPNYTSFGCGPAAAFDRSIGVGWGSDAPGSTFGSKTTGPRSVVVHLPRAIDVTSFGFAPGATCGDPPSAGVRAFDIFTRTANGTWVLAVSRDTALPAGVLNRLVPDRGTRNVRYVKLTMRSNRGNPDFMDMQELSVRGR